MTSGIQTRDSKLKISNPLTGRHFHSADALLLWTARLCCGYPDPSGATKPYLSKSWCGGTFNSFPFARLECNAYHVRNERP